MKHSFLIKSTVVSGLLMFGCAAFAQDRDRDRDEDRYHQLNRDEGWWQGHLFQRIREDLDHIKDSTQTISTDEFRLAATQHDLNELQAKMDSHRYDQPELDRVINGVEKVLSNNRMSGRDRELLTDDLRRLRDFRDHHDGYRG
jgi:hypothetical protein